MRSEGEREKVKLERGKYNNIFVFFARFTSLLIFHFLLVSDIFHILGLAHKWKRGYISDGTKRSNETPPPLSPLLLTLTLRD
jgi:hypothetical protein